MTNSLANLAVFAPVDQHYLLQARQMQALSLSRSLERGREPAAMPSLPEDVDLSLRLAGQPAWIVGDAPG